MTQRLMLSVIDMAIFKKAALVFFMSVSLLLSTARCYAAQCIDAVYDDGVTSRVRGNIDKTIDVVADLLTKYNLVLSEKITVAVSADEESYAQALMFYLKYSRQYAKEQAQYTAGTSSNKMPLIIVKGSADMDESFRVLPHEIFHQVQRQYGRLGTVPWLTEGAPEVFQFIARETAGLEKASLNVSAARERVRMAREIPDAHELACSSYKQWESLMRKYPVYDMAVLMTYQLMQGNGFESIIFFYQLLHNGISANSAFQAAFRVPMSYFLDEMNEMFCKLRM